MTKIVKKKTFSVNKKKKILNLNDFKINKELTVKNRRRLFKNCRMR